MTDIELLQGFDWPSDPATGVPGRKWRAPVYRGGAHPCGGRWSGSRDGSAHGGELRGQGGGDGRYPVAGCDETLPHVAGLLGECRCSEELGGAAESVGDRLTLLEHLSERVGGGAPWAA